VHQKAPLSRTALIPLQLLLLLHHEAHHS
jgi:hypothetical protein